MTQVNLPKLNQSGVNEWADVQDNLVVLRDVINGNLDNTNISSTAAIDQSKIVFTAGMSRSAKATLASPFSTPSTTFVTALTASITLPSAGFVQMLFAGQAAATSSSGEIQISVNDVVGTSVAFSSNMNIVSINTSAVVVASARFPSPFTIPAAAGASTVVVQIRKTAGTSADLATGTLFFAALT